MGVPGDAEFQHRVLAKALGLFAEESGPVFVEFGEEIRDQADQPASCPIPPFHDADAHPAANEARGLRAAHDRTLVSVGRTATPSLGERDRAG